MVNINDFKTLTEFLSNKAQSGGTLKVTQFNQLCLRAMMTKYEKDYQTFLATEEVSEYLKTYFKNSVQSVPLTGLLNFPSDFQHLSSLRKYYVKPNGQGMMIPVKEVNNVAYGFSQISSLQEPSLRFPKYSEFATNIRFLPKNLGIVEMDYFRTPLTPVWGFTTVNGRPVYNSATSTDLEIAEFSVNEIAGLFLQLIGVNLSDQNIANFANQYKQENNSVI